MVDEKIKSPQRKLPKKRSSSKTQSAVGKGKPWTFPKNTLEDSIRVAREIEEKNAGNPMPAKDLALAVGFRQSNDWRFLDLLRSASQYGLITGTGPAATIHLAKFGQDVVAPSSPRERANALLAAFRNVKDFEAVQDYYGGKRIPEDEFFLNTLAREFSIPRERVAAFAKIFLENLKYLRAFSGSSSLIETPIQTEPELTPTLSDGLVKESSVLTSSGQSILRSKFGPDTRVREFLDTCFVMMPFGAWFDRYYQEIYVTAIKEAGFEPVRADELFTTGSVVEQIWEQIEKSKVLLADLSGKNPNVFYELGLAHAAKKPVVFTASAVEDVPFDLRHLRVIIYEVREPNWAAKLQSNITDYLKNAAKEPGKSIPHPFRKIVEDLALPTPGKGKSTGRVTEG